MKYQLIVTALLAASLVGCQANRCSLKPVQPREP